MILSRTFVSSTAAFQLFLALVAGTSSKSLNVASARADDIATISSYCKLTQDSRLVVGFANDNCDDGKCEELAEALKGCVLRNVDLFLLGADFPEEPVTINNYISGEVIKGVKFRGVIVDQDDESSTSQIDGILKGNHAPLPIIGAHFTTASAGTALLNGVNEILIIGGQADQDSVPIKIFETPSPGTVKKDAPNLEAALIEAGAAYLVGTYRLVGLALKEVTEEGTETPNTILPAPTTQVISSSLENSLVKNSVTSTKTEVTTSSATSDKPNESVVTPVNSITIESSTVQGVVAQNISTTTHSSAGGDSASKNLTIPIHTATITETHTTTVSSENCDGDSTCEVATSTASYVVRVELCVSVPTDCVVCQPKETRVYNCLEGECPQDKVSLVTRDFGTPVTRVGRSAVAGEGWSVEAQPTKSAPIKSITLTACEDQTCRTTAIPLLVDSRKAPVTGQEAHDVNSDKAGQPHTSIKDGDDECSCSTTDTSPKSQTASIAPSTRASISQTKSSHGVASQPVLPIEAFEGVAAKSSFSFLAVSALLMALV